MSRKEQQQPQQQQSKKQSLTHRMKLFSLKCLILLMVALVVTFAFIQFASSSQRESIETPKRLCQKAKDSVLGWKLQTVEDNTKLHRKKDVDGVQAQQTSVGSHPRNLRFKFAVVRELAYTILMKRCRIFDPLDGDGNKNGNGIRNDETWSAIFEQAISDTVTLNGELAELVDKLDTELPEDYTQFMENYIKGIGDPHIFEKIDS